MKLQATRHLDTKLGETNNVLIDRDFNFMNKLRTNKHTHKVHDVFDNQHFNKDSLACQSDTVCLCT